ncbi:hypothetical protein PGT21_006623 [Puccinia graminis f. sp. tritici]|uniref:hAT-like transposase RNase-H fold domain-containing protein n=1 Tax=Puccinia graminis f. sp. tritici TaxID=56615 RepID=A0A5B0PIS4_PUCGR|nr:hypothetical protein PGT21_006623 [Puccinia graminis f. sp. tritici]
MFDILADKNGTYSFDWRPKEMHIRCFCHKIALILNAGLAELGIAAPPPPKVKESILGTFPYSDTMPTILEEDEEDNMNEEDIRSPVNNYVDTNDDIDDKHDEEEVKAMMKEKKERKKNKGSNEDSEDKGEEFQEVFEDPTEFHATNRYASNELDRLTKKVRFQHSSHSTNLS